MRVKDWLRTPEFEGMRDEARCKVAAELDDQEYDTTSLIAQMSDQELAQMSDKLQLKPPPRRMLAAAISKLRQSVTQHGGAATEQGVEPSALTCSLGLSHPATMMTSSSSRKSTEAATSSVSRRRVSSKTPQMPRLTPAYLRMFLNRHSSQLKRNAEELVRNNADVLSPAIRARCGAMRIPKLDHENP